MTTNQMHIWSLVSTLKSDIDVVIIKKFIIIVQFSYGNIASEERFKMYNYLFN